MSGPDPRRAEVSEVTDSMVTVRDCTGELHFFRRGALNYPRGVSVGQFGTVTYRVSGSLGLWWFRADLPQAARQTFLNRAAMIAALHASELYREHHSSWFQVEEERVMLNLDSPNPICVGGLDDNGWWLALPTVSEFHSFLRTLYGLDGS